MIAPVGVEIDSEQLRISALDMAFCQPGNSHWSEEQEEEVVELLEEEVETQMNLIVILNRREMTAGPGKNIPAACSESKRKE